MPVTTCGFERVFLPDCYDISKTFYLSGAVCYVICAAAGIFANCCDISKALSFSLNQAILCETNLYHHHYIDNAFIGWNHFFPGILVEKYDLIKGRAD